MTHKEVTERTHPMGVRERLTKQAEKYLNQYREQQKLGAEEMSALVREIMKVQSDLIKELEREIRELKGEPHPTAGANNGMEES
jgi:glutamate/tyrosine decarboxylase-like PLP-dependent enzyme